MKLINKSFKKIIFIALFFQIDFLFSETCTENICLPCNNLACDNIGCDTCHKKDIRFHFDCISCNNCSPCNRKFRPECLPCYKKVCKKDCEISCNIPRTIFIPRSQGANTARELIGWEEYLHRFPECNNYINTAHTLEYTQSFRPERISRYLFGDCKLSFAGSQVKDRTACEIIADNFGLSPNFRGNLNFEPIIQNIILDNQIFVGLDRFSQGLYARINAPLVYSIWDLNIRQRILSDDENCTDFPQCQMSGQSANAICNLRKALSGNFKFGDMQTPWKAGRFCSRQTKFGLADLDLILGYDFFKCENYHLGFYAQTVVPTGNKPNPRYIFSPIVGNGKHWEFGAGISGHLMLWNNGPDENLCIYLEGNVTHMFKNTQCRSFDLCPNGPLSRYLLLKELKQNGDNFEYNNNLINAINLTTQKISSKVSVKADISAKLAYRSRCFSADLGYNFYGNTEEKIKLKNCNLTSNYYGIKGSEGTCALEYSTTGTVPNNFGNLVQKISLNSTQSNATLRSNAPTDNPADVPLTNNNDIAVTYNSRQTGPVTGQDVIIAKESKNPKILDKKNLNLQSGKAGATATNKIFANINYNFDESCYPNYTPFIGIGGELEIEGLACNEQTSLNQWGLWIKGGVAF